MKEDQTLPLYEPAVAPVPSRTSLPHRILVVEDDGDLRSLNTEVLTRCGYQVDGAEDGDAGWAALASGSYDLLITDNNMPKLTGLDLLKKLRAARMVLPVIMATGTLPAHEYAQSPWLIPDATLLKPYTIAELLAQVQAVLRKTAGDREASDPQPPAPSPSAIKIASPDFELSVLDWNEVDQVSVNRSHPPS